MFLDLVFFSFVLGVLSTWELTGKDSHMNSLSNFQATNREWQLNFNNGYIFNGQLVINEDGTFIFTLTQGNNDNTTSEYLVWVDLDSGKEVDRVEIKTEKTINLEESYGGLVSMSGKYIFVKSDMMCDIHAFDLTTKTFETGYFITPSPLNLPLFLYGDGEGHIVFPNITTRCEDNSTDQCMTLISRDLKFEGIDWLTSFQIPDSCRASEYVFSKDSDGIIYVMSDYCDVKDNEIYKINSKDGSLMKKIEIPGGTVSEAGQITVSNINSEGLSNYYFSQKSRKDKKTYLFGISKATDVMVWKEKISGTEFQSCSQSALNYDGTTISLVCPGYVTSVLYSINSKDGSKLFTKTILDGFCLWTSTMNNGNVVVVCDNLVVNNIKIYVFNEKGHELKKWEYKKMIFEQMPIIDAGNNVYYCVTNYKEANCYKKSLNM